MVRCQAHDSRADSFVLTSLLECPTNLKNLSASMQIHEVYCECSPVDVVINITLMKGKVVVAEVS
jgi:hypothetical protein